MKKSSLALQYFPESTAKTATRHLMRWINRCPPLLAELAPTGWSPTQKMFSPWQTAIIRRHLGEAEEA